VRIAVIVKQVPDTDEVKLDPETGSSASNSFGTVINPLDLDAIEAALNIRNRAGGSVTAISMGSPAAEEAFREQQRWA